MKITVNVFWRQWDWQDKGSFYIASDEVKNYDSKAYLFIRAIEVELPDIVEPTREQIVRAKVAGLESERKAIMAETQMRLNAIDDKIKQLSCIEYKEVEVL